MKVALIFDDVVRPDTTGGYCLRALRQIADVEHYRPGDLQRIPRSGFDLYLYIDDGLDYGICDDLRPSAVWAIDTHICPARILRRASVADHVFVAQRDGVELMAINGARCRGWLPLACDPEVHRPPATRKRWDTCFVAHLNTAPRRRLAEVIAERYPNSFIGQRFFGDMARTYAESRIVLNLSARNDVNMRVFEGAASGTLLLTNDLAYNGLDRLFRYGEHIVSYTDLDELVCKIDYYLTHETEREEIAARAREHAIASHTYRHRMAVLLDHVLGQGTASLNLEGKSRIDSKGATIEVCSSTGRYEESPAGAFPRCTRSGPTHITSCAGDALASIVVVTRNQLLHTRRCVESVLEQTKNDRFELIVVDNGSTDGTREYLRDCRDVRLIENSTNKGFPKAANQGISVSVGEMVVLLNNDVIVTEGWLSRIRAVMRSAPDIGLVGPCSNNVHGPQRVRVIYDGDEISSIQEFSRKFAKVHAGRVQEADVLVGFCMAIRREVINCIGSLEEGYGLGTFEDYDYCRRAGAAGFRSFIAADALVHHAGAATFAAEGIDLPALLRRNGSVFRSRWMERDVCHGSTSIVMVTFNQIECTRACIASITRNTGEPYELIVVDNGSTDGTLEFLRERTDLRLIENGRNLGFPAAANKGLAAAQGERLLLLNNDVLVTPGWLQRLTRALYSGCDVGLAGPCSNRISGAQQISVTYDDPADCDEFAKTLAGQYARQTTDTDRLVGFCLLMRRDVFDRVGLLDERFGLGNYEDDDYCLRAALAGFRAVIARDCFVHHFGSATFRGEGVNLAGLMNQNRHIFMEKWSAGSQSSASANASAPKAEVCPPTRYEVGPASDGEHHAATRSRPRLSMCMIARDSSRTIGAALKSVKPWADELIVVDTGSRDATPAIAHDLGARVSQFPWCDDFAAARNESLRLASGEWIFWMDSDDTIDETNGLGLRNLVHRDHPPSIMGFVVQVHCPAASGNGISRTGTCGYSSPTAVDHVKVVRNRPEIRFTGRIHEQVLPSIRALGGDVAWTDLFVVHSGSDGSDKARARKHERDLRLLELETAEHPDSTFALFNLGMTLLDAGRYPDALVALCRSYQLSSPQESHVRKLYALLVHCHASLGWSDAARSTCRRGLEVFPDDPELLFRQGILEQAVGRLHEAEDSFKRVLAGGRERVFRSVDQGILGVKSWHNLAIVYEKRGDWSSAASAWHHVVEHDPSSIAAWRALLAALSAAKDVAGLTNVLKRAQKTPEASPEIALMARARLLDANGDSDSAVSILQRDIDSAGDACSLDLLQELCELAFRRHFVELAETSLQKLVRREPDDAAAHQNLAAILLRRGDFGGARRHAERSLALRPGFPLAEKLLTAALGQEAAMST